MSTSELIKKWNVSDKTSDGLYFLEITYGSSQWEEYKEWVGRTNHKLIGVSIVPRLYDLNIEDKDMYRMNKEVSSLFGEPHPKARIHPSKNQIIQMTESIQNSNSQLIASIPVGGYVTTLSYHWPRLAIDVIVNKSG
jgi:hypothetical protein